MLCFYLIRVLVLSYMVQWCPSRWLDGNRYRISAVIVRRVMDLEHESFAIKRTKVHVRRLKVMFQQIVPLKDKFAELKLWKKPWENMLAMVVWGLLVLYPSHAIAALIMLFAAWCSMNYR